MAHDHAHSTGGDNETSLRWAFGLTAIFLIAEVIGGVLAQSLALISDAAHMFTDTAALAIALAAIRIGKRPADKLRTFGYYRFEILAAAFNAVLLFFVALYILYEAYRRFQQPPQIESGVMLIVAVIGLVVNLISMRLLRAGADKSLNVKGAYLEVWSDMLGSIGVIVGALLIRYAGWTWVDTVVAILIALWVLPRTWRLLRESINVLLEGVPSGMALDQIEAAIQSTPGVASLHDLHVWSITSGKVSLTVHVVCDGTVVDPTDLTKRLRAMCAERFDIHHSTLQVEREACDQAASLHSFGPVSVNDRTAHAH
jgi:cobalt-zinc-cadmium efflux system protein